MKLQFPFPLECAAVEVEQPGLLLFEEFEVGLAALHPQPYGQAPAVLVNVYVAGSSVKYHSHASRRFR